jgi:16S rRNA (uracil1498-N3)-methyltransferase
MRLEAGDMVIIVDGMGNGYRAEIVRRSRSELECRLINRIRRFGEPSKAVRLAAGLSTGYKFAEVIERATEIGISAFVPLLTKKSLVKIDDEKRRTNKATRWNKVAIAAMKQARRSLLPVIEKPLAFDDFLKRLDKDEIKILFDPQNGGESLENALRFEAAERITLIIGPESGFSREEVAAAREAGCRVVSLGQRILRTENASPSAAAIVMFLLNELR